MVNWSCRPGRAGALTSTRKRSRRIRPRTRIHKRGHEMVYELRTYTLIPGKMPEYLKAAETIGRPARGQNYGVNHGYWTSEFGALNQIWHLWKYDSLNDQIGRASCRERV